MAAPKLEHETAKDFLAMLNTLAAAPSVEPHHIIISSSSSSSSNSSSCSVKLIETSTGVDEEQPFNNNNTKESGGSADPNQLLTVFYGGKVYAYQNIPPIQIGAMLTIAQRLSEAATSPPPPPVRFEGTSINPSEGADLHQKDPINTPHISPVPRIEQLPISRKASLARFFAKRNERLKSLGLIREKSSQPIQFLEAKRNSEAIADAGSGCSEPSKPKKQCMGKANELIVT